MALIVNINHYYIMQAHRVTLYIRVCIVIIN